MQSIHVSAPAKLFLLGEHAVVYGGQAIVTAVDARLHTTLSTHLSEHPTVTIDAPDVGLAGWQAPLQAVVKKTEFVGESRFIEGCIAIFHDAYPITDSLHISTRSTFDKNLGLGSSSATVAAVLYALAQAFAPQVSLQQLFEMGLDAIRAVQQKVGSGADLAAALFGGTVYYVNRTPRQIVPLEINDLPIVAVYSGNKAGTVSYVQQVRALHDAYPTAVQPIIHSMLEVVELGHTAIKQGDWQTFGQLMNVQHGLLHALGVDTLPLAEVVFAARAAGAYGAKLSGAGGGDCAVVLLDPAHYEQLQHAIAAIGRAILAFDLNADGVRLENEKASN